MITVGADPELFVRRKNHWVSGHVFACGTKSEPLKTPNGTVQVDGVALECNVRPSSTADEFVSNCKGVLNDLSSIVWNTDPQSVLVAVPSIFLGTRKIKALPAEVGNLGCTPDFNAYTGHTNPRPDKNSPIRTGSGHIHIGWTKNENPRSISHFVRCQRITRELDFTIGLPSILWDRDQRRRSLYGKAGAFRPKPYGVEYRTPSNRWLVDDDLIRYVFTGAVKAVAAAEDTNSFYIVYGDLARRLINTGDASWPSAFPELAVQLGVPT